VEKHAPCGGLEPREARFADIKIQVIEPNGHGSPGMPVILTARWEPREEEPLERYLRTAVTDDDGHARFQVPIEPPLEPGLDTSYALRLLLSQSEFFEAQMLAETGEWKLNLLRPTSPSLLADQHPFVTGRLVDRDLRPLVDLRVACTVRLHPAPAALPPWIQEVRTDHEGRFAVPCEILPSASALRTATFSAAPWDATSKAALGEASATAVPVTCW
jgi:hypothetical protein